MSSWRFDSRPITVWWRSTWLRTEPRAYFVGVLFVTASSTASLIARPSEPEHSGSCASICRPAFVLGLGDATTVAPQVSIMFRRYGFWS